MISQPLATSMTWDLRALALSRVIMMGGLGLFLDPAGRPRGRLVTSPSPERESDSLPSEVVAPPADEWLFLLSSDLIWFWWCW